MNRAFTPRMIDGLRPFIRAKAEELTERLATANAGEFVEEFGNPLPLAVMCELLGVPAADYDTFRVWTADVGLVFSLAQGANPAKLRNLIVTLVFAAHDTTRHQLGNAMVAFAAHPDQWRLLASSPFDITVAPAAPPLQFGGGPHHCLGSALARTEIAEVLPVLTGRLGPPVVAGPVGWRPPIGIHGPEPLPLRFEAR